MPHAICSIEGCDKLNLARTYCGMHYRRLRVYGHPLAGNAFHLESPDRLCDIEGCGRVHSAAGLCSAHMARKKRHGAPTAGRGSAALGIAARVTSCAAESCDAESKAGGMCWSHYNRQRYLADPETWARYAAEYRARERGATIERFTTSDILERDNWRCGLCGKRIPKNRKHPDPLSSSLDHIVPLSQGGEHSRRNTQAAHLVCNLRKGTRGQAQQLRLLG